MRDIEQIQKMLGRVNQETAHDDLNEEDCGVLSVQDALRWVVDTSLPEDWLDGYFRER